MDEIIRDVDPYAPPTSCQSPTVLKTWPLYFIVFLCGIGTLSFLLESIKEGFLSRTSGGRLSITSTEGFSIVLKHLIECFVCFAVTNTLWQHGRSIKAFVGHSWRDPMVALIPIFNRLWKNLAVIVIAYFLSLLAHQILLNIIWKFSSDY